MDLYKIVGPNGECLNGGHGDWPLPTDTEPGEWRDVDGPLEACRVGLHLADADQLPHWLPSPSRPCIVYRVETRGEVIDAGEKWVAQSVRLLPRGRVPDFAKAERLRASRRKRAERLRTVAVPDVWRGYLRNVSTLPAGHPGARYLAVLNAADAAYDAAMRKAETDYTADIARGAMPD